MATPYISVDCMMCGSEIGLECEVEPADESVGIMATGLIPPDAPEQCPHCEAYFSPDQRVVLQTAILQACYNWQASDDDEEEPE